MFIEPRGLVDAEDCCVAWRIYQGFCRSSLNCILDSVEEEFRAKELEKVARDSFGNVGLEVEEIKVGLVIDNYCFFGRSKIERFEYAGR